ncbi:hypothetical protein D3C78_1222770 [compost metagenome]
MNVASVRDFNKGRHLDPGGQVFKDRADRGQRRFVAADQKMGHIRGKAEAAARPGELDDISDPGPLRPGRTRTITMQNEVDVHLGIAFVIIADRIGPAAWLFAFRCRDKQFDPLRRPADRETFKRV